MPLPVLLASASPRRRKLIELIGLAAIGMSSPHVDETMDTALSPEENVTRLALRKASALAPQCDSKTLIIAGDTTVVLDGSILNKPRDTDDAIRMLRLLSGNTHTVHTGIALLLSDSMESYSFVTSTQVTFRDLNEHEVAAYVRTGAPMDKAGSYGIQEDHGAVFVTRIEGDYYNVVGLPLCDLFVAIRRFAPDALRQNNSNPDNAE